MTGTERTIGYPLLACLTSLDTLILMACHNVPA